MTTLDLLYIRLLHHGLVKLRDLVAAGDEEWAFTTAEMLHNIPSLIGEANDRRHLFYWRSERIAYIEWLKKSRSEEATAFTRAFFYPIWREMEVELQDLLS